MRLRAHSVKAKRRSAVRNRVAHEMYGIPIAYLHERK